MSIIRQPSTDDGDEISKTLEQSVIIHPEQSIGAPDVHYVTKSMPANLHKISTEYPSKSQSPPLGGMKSMHDQQHSSSLNQAMSSMHSRESSVSNLVPQRYANQVPSLIALLDVQRTNMSRPSSSRSFLPKHDMNASKSFPNYAVGNNTPSVVDENYPTLAPLQDSPAPALGNKARGSTENIFANGDDSNHQLQDSEENLVIVNGGTDSKLLADNASTTSIDSFGGKEEEYKKFIPNTGNHDQMVDMQLLAAKAAEEFALLANENDKLFKENSTLKERYDDVIHEKMKIEEELNLMKNVQNNSDDILDDIDTLRSKAKQWEIEKKVLMDQLAEAQHGGHNGKNRHSTKNGDSLVGKTALKLSNDTSEDAQRLTMEALVKITREKNGLENTLEAEKALKKEYEKTISSLKKQLKESELERGILSNHLDKQQTLYLSLKESAKKKELEIVGRARGLSLEQQQHEEQQKMELLTAVDEQKAYIEELEAKNQELMAIKIKDDDMMFSELNQLRKHNFAKSINFDQQSNFDGSEYQQSRNHSRAGSQSFSNFSHSGGVGIYNYHHAAYASNADMHLKTIRSQLNMYNMDSEQDLNEEMEDDDTKLINYPSKDLEAADEAADTLAVDKSHKKKVSFINNKSTDKDKEKEAKEKEEKKRKQMEERFKVNAEIEFFLLTCIAVKANLVEEYPNNPEVMTEDAMKLFVDAQKEHVVMSKFNLWIELKLREKYDLPKLRGFKKFMEKHGIKEKLDETKQKSKDLAKKTGHLISQKAQEIEMRVRSFSKQGTMSPSEPDMTSTSIQNSDPTQTNGGGGPYALTVNGNENGKVIDKKPTDDGGDKKDDGNDKEIEQTLDNQQCCNCIIQ